MVGYKFSELNLVFYEVEYLGCTCYSSPFREIVEPRVHSAMMPLSRNLAHYIWSKSFSQWKTQKKTFTVMKPLVMSGSHGFCNTESDHTVFKLRGGKIRVRH